MAPALSTITDFDTNWLTEYYEAKTNVHVNWSVAPTDQFKERVNLAFASEDPLDLVLAGNSTVFKLIDVLNMANQRLIIPIQSYIDSDTINIKKNIPAYEGWRQVLTTPDGSIYAVPSLVEAYHVQYYGKLWINKVFMSNLGLKVPTTINEFHDMLLAFKNRDANGNGDSNDEIPMMGATNSFGAKVDTFIVSAYIYDDGDNRLWLENGKVVASYTRPEFQQGLRTLYQWYTEGLIHKDSFINLRAQRNQVNSQKYESLIGAIPGINHGDMGTRPTGEPVRWIDYEPISPLAGPNGLQITRYDYYDKFMPSGGFWAVVPSTCRNPALILRWLDWFHSEEGTVAATQGGEGITWKAADPGAIGADGRPAIRQRIRLQQGDKYYNNSSWSGLIPVFETQDIRSGQQTLPSVDANMLNPDGSGAERFLYIMSRDNYAPYGIKPENQIPPLYYSQADVSEMVNLTTNINTYVEESIAKFIVGDLNVDRDWNTFQQTLKNLGIERYLKIIQDTYDRSSFKR
jgi:putative aldouronate transport system substrate-binding protein